VNFVVDSVALTLGFSERVRFPPSSTDAPYASSSPHAAVTRRTKDRAQGTFHSQCCFGNCGALDRKLLSSFKGLISSEGKPAVSVCREQMASSFGLALPHVEPNPSPCLCTCSSFTEPSVGAALRRVKQRVELL